MTTTTKTEAKRFIQAITSIRGNKHIYVATKDMLTYRTILVNLLRHLYAAARKANAGTSVISAITHIGEGLTCKPGGEMEKVYAASFKDEWGIVRAWSKCK